MLCSVYEDFYFSRKKKMSNSKRWKNLWKGAITIVEERKVKQILEVKVEGKRGQRTT